MIDDNQAALFSALGREWDSPVPLDAAGRARWRAHALAAIRPVQLERDLDDGICAEFVDALLVTGWELAVAKACIARGDPVPQWAWYGSPWGPETPGLAR